MALVEAAEGEQPAPPLVRPDAAWRESIITMLTGIWILTGLVVDATAHGNFAQIESFFNPWHAAVYSGYVVSAVWMMTLAVRHGAGRLGILSALPTGHVWSGAGLLIFGLSGAADMFWHITFGFEQGSQALLTPSHAGLFLGTVLIISTPFRVAWLRRDDRSVSWRAFLPALLSLTFTVLVLALAFQWLWPFYYDQHKWRLWFSLLLRDLALPGTPIASALFEVTMRGGLSHLLLANALVVGPILLILRRWHPPFGSLTIFLVMIVGPGTRYELLPVSLLAGLAADGLVHLLHPSPERLGAFRLFAFTFPLLLWALYFAAILGPWGLHWSPTVYGAAISWAAISTLGLSVLMVPTSAPVPGEPVAGASPIA